MTASKKTPGVTVVTRKISRASNVQPHYRISGVDDLWSCGCFTTLEKVRVQYHPLKISSKTPLEYLRIILLGPPKKRKRQGSVGWIYDWRSKSSFLGQWNSFFYPIFVCVTVIFLTDSTIKFITMKKVQPFGENMFVIFFQPPFPAANLRLTYCKTTFDLQISLPPTRSPQRDIIGEAIQCQLAVGDLGENSDPFGDWSPPTDVDDYKIPTDSWDVFFHSCCVFCCFWHFAKTYVAKRCGATPFLILLRKLTNLQVPETGWATGNKTLTWHCLKQLHV